MTKKGLFFQGFFARMTVGRALHPTQAIQMSGLTIAKISRASSCGQRSSLMTRKQGIPSIIHGKEIKRLTLNSRSGTLFQDLEEEKNRFFSFGETLSVLFWAIFDPGHPEVVGCTEGISRLIAKANDL